MAVSLIWTVIFILTETVFLWKDPRNVTKKSPFFDGIKVKKVIQNEKLPIKDETVMNTAVALSTIFAKMIRFRITLNLKTTDRSVLFTGISQLNLERMNIWKTK